MEIVAPVATDGVCTSIVDRQANRFVPEIQLQSICSGDEDGAQVPAGGIGASKLQLVRMTGMTIEAYYAGQEGKH